MALLLVDVINDLEFPGGDRLLEPALAAAERLAAFKARARAAGVPVIYANDNFGRWRSDFCQVVERCQGARVRGQRLAELLAPGPDDYAVLKPKHSAFFATPLDLLLDTLGCTRLVVGGFTADLCVQFTAQDAYVRGLELVVPRDAVASIDPDDNEAALAYMARALRADTTALADLDLDALRREAAASA